MATFVPTKETGTSNFFPDMDLNGFLDASIYGVTIRMILSIVIKGAVIYLFVRIATSLAKYLFRRSQNVQGKIPIDETKVGFLKQIVMAAIYLIGISAFLSLIPGMERVSDSILASAGILAMAVGLASQEALSNLIGGMFIIFSHPFKVGDFIQVDGTSSGTVVEISLRHTILRTLENRMILIPNNKINSSTIINSSYDDTSTCSFVEIGVSYTTDLDRAIDVMRDEIMKHPLLIDHRSEADKERGVPQVVIRVIKLGDSSITLRAWAWASTNANSYIMYWDLLKAVKQRFDREGIEIPYPYFNQIVKREA